ncbi:MAG: 3-hydroxyacyl-[acyl-carrier-protein] dehydratase FabZ [Rhodobacterales bacterium TMED271]|nr:MAG: 3-hydroxyacyl-[acyl-carrier-protein] dehydratase FabZ [Rhodobacterales bacterium TMED271]|tara:strand:- start:141 stop:584 length:444 start_codon:yes stop_codon:yes gene_type:complete
MTTECCNIDEIKKLIPHRYPFLLIDKVTDIVKNESATGVKNVTVNEPYFPGHFPSSSVVPGVLQVESMAQTAAVLVAKSLNFSESNALVLLTTIDNAKFRKPVIPGDVMSLVISVKRIRNKLWKFYGQVMVNSQRVSECEFSAMMRI